MYVEGSMDCIAKQFTNRNASGRIVPTNWDVTATLNYEWAYIPLLSNAVSAALVDGAAWGDDAVFEGFYGNSSNSEVVFYVGHIEYVYSYGLSEAGCFSSVLYNKTYSKQVLF